LTGGSEPGENTAGTYSDSSVSGFEVVEGLSNLFGIIVTDCAFDREACIVTRGVEAAEERGMVIDAGTGREATGISGMDMCQDIRRIDNRF